MDSSSNQFLGRAVNQNVLLILVCCVVQTGCGPAVVQPGPLPQTSGPIEVEQNDRVPLDETGSGLKTRRPSDVLGPIHQEENAHYHEVQQGDTLGSIAQRYQVSLDRLIRENGLNEPDQLQPGQLLYIPNYTPSADRKDSQ